MPDYPAQWRHVLEILASSPKGCTASFLAATGFPSAVIAGLVDCGLVAARTERVLDSQRVLDITWFAITDRGRTVIDHAT
jgi:hypothetical protein